MDWYHGTRQLFETFDFDRHRCGVDDWNVFLGVHFAANADTALGFARGDGVLIVAQLAGCFYDAGCESEQMAPEAARAAYRLGVLDPALLEQAICDSPESYPEDHAEARALRIDLETFGEQALFYPAHERAVSWALGGSEALGRAVATCYRDQLEQQGYAGVHYANAYEGGGICAIAFRPQTISIVERLTVKEFERRNRERSLAAA